jgi:hypothetical protein
MASGHQPALRYVGARAVGEEERKDIERRRVVMITRKNLNDRQRRLLGLLTTSFERQRTLDRTTGALFYPQLRADVVAAGATEGDFECLTEHLIGLIVEHTGSRLTSDAKKAQLDLISKHFAFRDFSVRVAASVLVAVDFADPPTRH